jgi:hypothetical protein
MSKNIPGQGSLLIIIFLNVDISMGKSHDSILFYVVCSVCAKYLLNRHCKEWALAPRDTRKCILQIEFHAAFEKAANPLAPL